MYSDQDKIEKKRSRSQASGLLYSRRFGFANLKDWRVH